MGILSDIVNEDKVEMCPDACCGKPITECKCGPDCEHCDCHSKNKAMNEHDAKGIRKIASQVPFIGHKLHGHDHMPAPAEPVEEPYDDAILRIARKKKTDESPTGAVSGFAPQFQRPKDITNPQDALIHKGQTRGVNDPFDATGTGHADGIGWSQDELDAADAGFQSALDSANQIKINRYLANLPNDIAKGIASKYGYGVATGDDGKQFNPSWDGDYDHASNPNYGTDAMDPETIAKIKDPDWRNTYNMKDPKFKNIRPTEATNEEIEAEIQRLKDLIKY